MRNAAAGKVTDPFFPCCPDTAGSVGYPERHAHHDTYRHPACLFSYVVVGADLAGDPPSQLVALRHQDGPVEDTAGAVSPGAAAARLPPVLLCAGAVRGVARPAAGQPRADRLCICRPDQSWHPV